MSKLFLGSMGQRIPSGRITDSHLGAVVAIATSIDNDDLNSLIFNH